MLQHYHKLVAKYYGPYVVIKRIREVAYKLNLPSSPNIHPVFHVSLLKKSMRNKVVHKSLPDGPFITPRCITLNRTGKPRSSIGA